MIITLNEKSEKLIARAIEQEIQSRLKDIEIDYYHNDGKSNIEICVFYDSTKNIKVLKTSIRTFLKTLCEDKDGTDESPVIMLDEFILEANKLRADLLQS